MTPSEHFWGRRSCSTSAPTSWTSRTEVASASTRSERKHKQQIPHQTPASGTGTLEAAISSEPNPVLRFLKVLGPGLITGASDDDPSGIGTYAVAGASLGYSTLWTALLTLPLMASVQFVC